MKLSPRTKTLHLAVRELARSPYSVLSALQGGHEARAAIGRQVHAEVTAGATLREEFIQHELSCEGWTLRITGRIDGIEVTPDGWIVREYKTRFERIAASPRPPPEHEVRQLEAYLVLLALRQPGLVLRGELVEVYAASRQQRVHPVAAPDHATWHERCVRPWVTWAQAVVDHRERRTKLTIAFPHAEQRPAQRRIAAAVEEAYEAGQPLLLSAPTGSGKTAAVLATALRLACATGRQTLWLTAKTPQQALPLALTRHLSPDLRVVQLASKERLCLNGQVFCHPTVCPFLRDEPRKLEAAWPDLVAKRNWQTRTARAVGARHQVCPHLLAKRQLDLADLVIADYNYVFDPAVALPLATDPDRAREWVLVVDEAHNLADRARDYFTAALPYGDDPRLAPRLTGPLGEAIGELRQNLTDLEQDYAATVTGEELVPYEVPPATRRRLDETSFAAACAILLALDEYELPLLQALLAVTDEVRDFLPLLDRPAPAQQTLVNPLPRPTLKSLCLEAGPFLAERFPLFHHTTFMSATLHPSEYFQRLLGIADAVVRQLESDFDAERRQVLLVPTISTTYRDREPGLDKLAATLGTIVGASPGRVAAFFPSFAYLRTAAAALAPGVPLYQQESGESATSVRAKVEAFREQPRALFLAVTAGLLGEGVDFGDGGLQTLVIVGPALPAVSAEMELRRRYYDSQALDGFLWAYACPGMQRVIQAAGRLIRRPEDRGQIILLDQRFQRAPYRHLLPPDWQPRLAPRPAEHIAAFWADHRPE
jgi:Rad3-related DNA helicase